MRRFLPFLVLLIIFLVPGSTFAVTVLVNSTQDKEFKDLTLEERKVITGIENGVMDVLFEQGFIFFSHYMKKGSGSPFDTAREADADFLLVIYPESNGTSIVWEVFLVEGGATLASGVIVKKEQPGVEEMSESEFYYFSGGIIGQAMVQCARAK